ncbi:PQQ-binding-like beta-propeller repeat protein [Lentzea kentuckyensis]|uniref:outer membrane protein assembly factor BamB family protein n=1 Tax=Lentzea kentuckyensis TaxID=360086 RepID=UPI000A3B2E8B|nr:PQQ-binding-like beta-propeller repeat protein [Lentzea kentuckyensis]
MRKLVLAVVLLVSGCVAPAVTAPVAPALPAQPPGAPTWAPWPAALHDARHSGSSTSDGPVRGTVRWRRNLEGAVTPGPVIGADGTIYASSTAGVLHAIDPASGQDRWTYDSKDTGGGDLSVSPLVLPSGDIVWPTPGPLLLVLSSSGRRLWSVELPGIPTSPASVDGSRIYVGDTSGHVSAIDSRTRSLLWTVDVGRVSYGSVVTDGTRIYTTANSGVTAVDTDGTVAWQRDPGDDITEVSAGLAPDGTVLLGTNGSREWAYRPDGSPAWNVPRFITYSSPAVTATGLAYIGDHGGTVSAFDVRTGRIVRSYHLNGEQIWSSTIVDRNYRLYYANQVGHVYGLTPEGGVLFDVNVGGPVDSYPALSADGALVVGSRNGVLTSIG